jgi:hypothetical protein
MKTDTIQARAESAEGMLFHGDDWFDPLEAGVRTRIRGFIEELVEASLHPRLIDPRRSAALADEILSSALILDVVEGERYTQVQTLAYRRGCATIFQHGNSRNYPADSARSARA